jgi:hypothetical protein
VLYLNNNHARNEQYIFDKCQCTDMKHFVEYVFTIHVHKLQRAAEKRDGFEIKIIHNKKIIFLPSIFNKMKYTMNHLYTPFSSSK